MPIQTISSDLAQRAIAAYHRLCVREGAAFQQPSSPDCYRDTDTGDEFVVLRNVRGVLAMYRRRARQGALRLVQPNSCPPEVQGLVES